MRIGEWTATAFLACVVGGLAAIGGALGFGREWTRLDGRPRFNAWLFQEGLDL